MHSDATRAGIDYRRGEGDFPVFIENGSVPANASLREVVESTLRWGVGEIYLNSMDSDGTGQV